MKNIIYHLKLCSLTPVFLGSVTAISLLCFTCCPYTDYDINRSYSVLEVLFSEPRNLIESSYRFSSIKGVVEDDELVLSARMANGLASYVAGKSFSFRGRKTNN